MSRPSDNGRRGLLALGLCAATGGCFTSGEGREPSAEEFYFPTAVVASPGGTTLYVANSDFDLAFTGGTVLALDLEALRDTSATVASSFAAGNDIPTTCAQVGLLPNPDDWLEPGPCTPFPVGPFVRASVNIGAFASSMVLTHAPDADLARLFVTVRGDPSVTYFDVPDDRQGPAGFGLSCGAESTDDGFCDASHRLGQDPAKTLRGVQLPADPIGIAASSDGTALITAHQTQASASLLVNPWDGLPELTFVRGGLPNGPTELAALPRPAFIEGAIDAAADQGLEFQYGEGFLLTFRASSSLDILRFASDGGSSPPRPFLVRDRAFSVTVSASNFDSRGVAVFDGARRSCEATCGGDQACLESCAENVPLTVFLANRDPAALIVGQAITTIQRAGDLATGAVDDIIFFDQIPLAFGPTRVEVGHVVDDSGQLVERIFVVCFDARQIFMVDPVQRRVEAAIRTGRGPQDVAIDSGIADGEAFSYLYVSHFTDSYLGVVDLDQRRAATFGQVLANVGDPTPPIETR